MRPQSRDGVPVPTRCLARTPLRRWDAASRRRSGGSPMFQCPWAFDPSLARTGAARCQGHRGSTKRNRLREGGRAWQTNASERTSLRTSRACRRAGQRQGRRGTGGAVRAGRGPRLPARADDGGTGRDPRRVRADAHPRPHVQAGETAADVVLRRGARADGDPRERRGRRSGPGRAAPAGWDVAADPRPT